MGIKTRRIYKILIIIIYCYISEDKYPQWCDVEVDFNSTILLDQSYKQIKTSVQIN